jgi:methylated-DNA-protein-cysteine methyltransferase-like protein
VGFAEQVYDLVRRIPPGRVLTYGDIALLLGRARGGREVGWALAACHRTGVPAHRVVDRNGRLAPSFATQRSRLTDEGVRFVDGRVDLARHRWLARAGGSEIRRERLADRHPKALRDMQQALHRRQRPAALDHADERGGERRVRDARLRHPPFLA